MNARDGSEIRRHRAQNLVVIGAVNFIVNLVTLLAMVLMQINEIMLGIGVQNSPRFRAVVQRCIIIPESHQERRTDSLSTNERSRYRCLSKMEVTSCIEMQRSHRERPSVLFLVRASV